MREKGQGGGRGRGAGEGEAAQGGGARGRGGGGGAAAGQPQPRADAGGLGLGVATAAAVCAAAGAEGTRDCRGVDGGGGGGAGLLRERGGEDEGKAGEEGDPAPFSDLVGRTGRPRERGPEMDEGRWRRMLGEELPGPSLDCPQEKGRKSRVQMLRELLQQEGRYGGDAWDWAGAGPGCARGRGPGACGGTGRQDAGRDAREADAGDGRRWRRVRGGCDGHEERRKGAERRRYAGKGRETAEGRGGCGDGGHGWEPQAEGTGPEAGKRGDGAAEYGGAGGCRRSSRAAGRETYRWYGEQCGAEREAGRDAVVKWGTVPEQRTRS